VRARFLVATCALLGTALASAAPGAQPLVGPAPVPTTPDAGAPADAGAAASDDGGVVVGAPAPPPAGPLPAASQPQPPPWPPPWAPPPWAYYTDATEREHERPPRRYYGWQTFTVVSISASFFATGIAIISDEESPVGTGLMIAGISGYALGPPIVHWAHGNIGKGFASLAMHGAIPASTTLVGFAAGCGGGDFGACIVGTFIGWQVGILIPPLVDGTLLAWDDADDAVDVAGARPSRGLRIAPVATPGGIGVAGEF
jgi:hypothetical protein